MGTLPESDFKQPPTLLRMVSGLREVGQNSMVQVYNREKEFLRTEPDNSLEYYQEAHKHWGRVPSIYQGSKKGQ